MGTVGITTSSMAEDSHYHDNMHELDHHLKISNLPKIAKRRGQHCKVCKICGSLPEKFTIRSAKLKSKDAKVTAYQGLLTDLLKEIKQAEQFVAANQLTKPKLSQ